MQSDVTELIREMGQKPGMLLASSNAKVSKLRLDIIATQRRIVLGPLIRRASFQSAIQECFGTQKAFQAYVFKPPELQAFLGFAQMTQNTGFLICHINEHPQDLAVAIMKSTKRKSIDYVIHCAVPALFGYFSSKEHLDVAIQFYMKIADDLPEKAALPFFLPLLHSAATFRFIECAVTRFMEALVIDVNVKEDETGYIPIYGHFLGVCIVNALPLLPQPILNLFSVLRKWEVSTLHHLVLVAFLWSAMRRWIRSSPNSGYERFVEKIFEYLVGQNEIVSSIFSALWVCTSRYDLPLVYSSFGNQFLDFYLSVRDIQMIARMMHSVKMMPDTVTLDELEKVPPNRDGHCYFCQVYPRIKHSSAKPDSDSLLFQSNTQEVQVMEKLMGNTLYEHELENWLDVLRDGEIHVVAPLVRDEVTVKTEGSFMETYKRILAAFNLPRLARLVFLSLIEANYSRWLNRDVDVLRRLDEHFREVIDKAGPAGDIPDFHALTAKTSKAKTCVIVDAIRQLLCLDKSSFYERFVTLIRSMSRFMNFVTSEGLPDSAYPILLQQNKGDKFLSTFVILNNFAMKNPEFLSLCTDEDLTVWLKLEGAILVALQPDMVLLKTFITIQNKFNVVASQCMR